MKKLRIGFIGLGLMGLPMAKNILKEGFSLSVYNRTTSKTKELEKLGAVVVKSPSELASTVDVIITMVTKGSDVEAVLFGKNGVVTGAKKGLILIDMSTIGPTAVHKIVKKLEKYAIDFIDAPVTGSTPKAISGELTIFIGGKESIYTKVKPVLEAMGTNLQYVGKSGMGQAIKLINNHIIASTILALGEGIILSDVMGLPRDKTARILSTVPALSPFMNLKLPNFISNTFPLLFSTSNMQKDLGLAVSEMQKYKQRLPTLISTNKLYKKALKEGLGNEDMSSIIKILEK